MKNKTEAKLYWKIKIKLEAGIIKYKKITNGIEDKNWNCKDLKVSYFRISLNGPHLWPKRSHAGWTNNIKFILYHNVIFCNNI